MPDYTSWAGLLTPAPTQFGPDMKQIITLQNLAQQMQARQMVMQQEQQGQNALRQVFGNKDNIDQSTGLPKPSALGGVIQANPEMGGNLLRDISAVGHNRALAEAEQGKAFQGFQQAWVDKRKEAYAVYRQALETSGPEAALKAYNDSWAQGRADLASGYGAPPEWVNKIPQQAIPPEEALARNNSWDASHAKPMSPYQTAEIGIKQAELDERQRADLAKEQNQKKKASELFVGQVAGPDGKPSEITMRRDPSGKGYVNDETDEHVTPLSVPHKMGSKDASGGISEEDAKYLGQMYNLTGKFPSMYRDTESRAKILHAAAQDARESGKSPGDIIAAQAGVRADAMSLGQLTKVGDSATAYLKTALDNIKIVEEKMPKGVGTNWTWLNYWVQNGRVAFGDPNVPAYATALGTVANEYAKVMSGSTGAQGSTVDARREAASYLNQYQNTDQVYAALDVMKKDMENKRHEYQDQRKSIEGRIAKGGESAPSEATQPSAPSPGAPSTPPPTAGSTPTLRQGHEQEDFDALPHDTYFFAPDGKRKYKP